MQVFLILDATFVSPLLEVTVSPMQKAHHIVIIDSKCMKQWQKANSAIYSATGFEAFKYPAVKQADTF